MPVRMVLDEVAGGHVHALHEALDKLRVVVTDLVEMHNNRSPTTNKFTEVEAVLRTIQKSEHDLAMRVALAYREGNLTVASAPPIPPAPSRAIDLESEAGNG